MKPALLLLLGLLGLTVGGDAPRSTVQPGMPPGSLGRASVGNHGANRAARDLSATVHNLQSSLDRRSSTVSRGAAGDLWMDVDSLKRSGANVRAIEYYASDLEQSLRRGQQGSSAARHALNNLEYEAKVLRQRLQRQQE
jgi:hypothetical protein